MITLDLIGAIVLTASASLRWLQARYHQLMRGTGLIAKVTTPCGGGII